MTPLSPEEVLKQIAEALPEGCREHVIIIGSLAAGYYYFSGDPERSIRTKDVDCMFSPHAKAVSAAGTVTEQLLKANWAPKAGGEWSTPGTDETPEDKLPMIRLQPPGDRGSADWFLELLGAPDTQAQDAKTFRRVQTTMGHFAICSFNFLALAEWQPILTTLGVRIARPEMMALANMLHHPAIRPELIKGTTDKRSNKDLGRVLALAWLTQELDVRKETDTLSEWPNAMAIAFQEKFPDRAKELALGAGDGIVALLQSPADMNQALAICNRGLLASLEVGGPGFAAIGRRFLQSVIDPLRDIAATW
jgi:hypothetical protein